IWDAHDWSEIAGLEGHREAVFSLAFYGVNAPILASAGTDRTVRLWDVERRAVQSTITAHSEQVLAAAFSPDGKWLATGGADCYCHIWNVEKRLLSKKLEHDDWVHHVAFSPAGDRLATVPDGGVPIFWPTAELVRESAADSKAGEGDR